MGDAPSILENPYDLPLVINCQRLSKCGARGIDPAGNAFVQQKAMHNVPGIYE